MKPLMLAVVVLASTAAGASAQNAPSDERCRRHFNREHNDRCNCTAEAGGKVIAIDAKGFNRWDLPQPNVGRFAACLKRKGYRT